MATRMDALKAAAVVGLASLVSGEANIRESADNFGKDRSLYPQYTANDQHQPVHNNEGASWWHGGEVMPEAKAGKDEHGNEGGSSGWWQPGSSGKISKTHYEAEASGWWQPGSSGKAEKTVPEVEASGWWQAGSGKTEKMHHEAKASGSGVTEKTHPTPAGAEASGSGFTEMTHPTPASGWWQAGSGKSVKAKSAKAKSIKHTSGGHWWGSMPTTVSSTTAATAATTPAAKGDKSQDDDDITNTTITTTTSTWWVAPGGAKSHKSGKSAKADKSGKSAKTGETGWESTWTPPTPCGKAEDCEQPAPGGESGGEEQTEPAVPPPSMSPVAPLVPVTMAPVVGTGETRVAVTSSPTTIIDALISEAGWFQSGKGYETEELAYKRERVEGLAKQMEWKNSSSRPQVYSYLAVCAAAGLYYMLC